MTDGLTGARLCVFPEFGDERGHLVALENGKEIPFDIKRIFYIYGSERDIVRGQHANLHSDFVLINVSGTSRVKVDDGHQQEVFSLDRPNIGLFIPRMLWKDMYDFSPDSVLLCLASTPYDNSEYIRDYQDFLDRVAKHT